MGKRGGRIESVRKVDAGVYDERVPTSILGWLARWETETGPSQSQPNQPARACRSRAGAVWLDSALAGGVVVGLTVDSEAVAQLELLLHDTVSPAAKR